MQLSKAPVIASHSSCRKFTPGFERNMSDEMIELLGKKGGVIQINFGSAFLDGSIEVKRTAQREELAKLIEKAGVTEDSPEARKIIDKYRASHPSLFADVETVANHIDHVVKLAGIDHVGIGSDFDGVGDSLPTGLKDVGDYPNLIYLLLKKGYSEEDIAKVCYKNVWRVWKEVNRIAANT